jgi:sugar lactone lactonase YvrE
LSGDDTGRIVSYDPSTKEVRVLQKGIQFPNGLALTKDESFLVVAQTTTCRLTFKKVSLSAQVFLA